ncbi:homoserine kinase [Edaphobacter modestus]|uniref:Homoserine kinase n=1 Tax=Edaphobacter modestus TaxID=388466 RepID=A0A4Q7YPP5_9BACT|nr:homoserine kinase [Edaphobacter modestus]RZU39742.1 homoserine kinase [Edaphobacter modestus]
MTTPSLHLRLPATSANLGPGFDALGLAMSLYLTIEASVAESGAFHIDATGRDAAACSVIEDNLILTTYIDVLANAGKLSPRLHLKLHNEIPLGMGCGSSAAALLAGVMLANHFGQLLWNPQQVLEEACRREGHPDNVAACFLGGMTVSSVSEGVVITATYKENINWNLLLALPSASLSTSKARALLPDHYAREDAVANIQATALLVSAFALRRGDLLSVAMKDRVHQPYRMEACPLLARLLPLAGTPGILGVALSGAGPSVLLIAEGDSSPILSAIRDAAQNPGIEILQTTVSDGVGSQNGNSTGVTAG